MKVLRLCALVAALLLCASLSACGNAPAETNQTASYTTTDAANPSEQVQSDSTEATESTVTTKPVSPALHLPAYSVLQNANGAYIGVLFTYPDGSTYTWNSPLESALPIIVHLPGENAMEKFLFYEDNHGLLEYYLGDCLWAFDCIDFTARTVFFQYKNTLGHNYIFGTNGHGQESGCIEVQSNEFTLDPIRMICYQNYERFVNKEWDVEVCALNSGDTVPNVSAYSHAFSTLWSTWKWDGGERIYEFGDWLGENGKQVCRMSGLNTLYYSETPITEMNADFWSAILGDDKTYVDLCDKEPSMYTHGGLPVYCCAYEHNGIYDPFAEDGQIEEKELCDKYIYVVKIDEHYFMKLCGYQYDESRVVSSFITVVKNLFVY